MRAITVCIALVCVLLWLPGCGDDDLLQAKDEEIADLKQQVSSLEKEIASLRVLQLSCEEERSSLEQQIASLETRQSSWEEEELSLERQASLLEKEKSSLEQQIGSLQTRLSSCEKEKSSLEQQLSSWENAPRFLALVRGRITADSRQYYTAIFRVTAEMKNARLKGDFISRTGDIFVYVFDGVAYQNWIGGATAKTLYNSGKVVAGLIDLPITQPGGYFIVFSNRHSWITRKLIDATVDLEYYE